MPGKALATDRGLHGMKNWVIDFWPLTVLRLDLAYITSEIITGVLLQKLTLSLIEFDRNSTQMPRTKSDRTGLFGGASVDASSFHLP